MTIHEKAVLEFVQKHGRLPNRIATTREERMLRKHLERYAAPRTGLSFKRFLQKIGYKSQG